MSAPLAISMTWLRRAFGLSLVTNMGGFGLFLDPGGRPLGLRLPTSIAPSLGSSLFSLSSSSSWFPPPAVLLIEIPRSGFFIGDELVEVSTTPCKPICPPHQRLFAIINLTKK
ncbi:hypothetical protein G4B88_011152 [Cannabis sativa]|uniref:Uncharacterized protein n=1 Tax=Cannabis sativa TaxID=3483 RepID=A0A7J6G3A8_CANSA|nr:hypothetical protein G4B88_011152 [Cannabis sativa]